MKTVFLSALLMSAVLGCSNQSEFEKRIKSLEESQAKWSAVKTPSYSYEYNQVCFCLYVGEVKVLIDDNSVIAVLDLETDEELTVEQNGKTITMLNAYPEMFYTIDELFEELKDAAKDADELDLTFNPEYGYPTETFIDYYKEAIDDEITYLLKNLELLTTTTFQAR